MEYKMGQVNEKYIMYCYSITIFRINYSWTGCFAWVQQDLNVWEINKVAIQSFQSLCKFQLEYPTYFVIFTDTCVE